VGIYLSVADTRWVSTCQWLSPSQHGFIQGRSTESAAHSLISFCESSNITKCTTACAFLDIKSAFDAAWHPATLFRLIKKAVLCILSVLNFVFCQVGPLYCRIMAPRRHTLSTLDSPKADSFPHFSGLSSSIMSSDFRFRSFT